MTKQEQVRAIFIEEANEIIEKLDVDILRFEENVADFDLLNEIFRGVHTLKGNSNAFGFTRLGEFVHHFEDLLGHYRSSRENIEPQQLELFISSVDVIKEVMNYELNALEGFPKGYLESLENIKMLISPDLILPKPIEAAAVLNDLAMEFGLSCPEHIDSVVSQSIASHQERHTDGIFLFRIDLTLDKDSYKRGFDHFIFLRLLAEKAVSLESFFDMKSIEPLERFVCDENMIDRVSVVVLTPQNRTEVEDNFEFLFDHEYTLIEIERVVAPPKKSEESPKTIQAPIKNVIAPRSTIRIDTFKLDELFNSVGELVIAQNFITQNEKIRILEDESLNRATETLSKITKRIQDRVMSLRMVAIRDTFDKMKRVVHDTSKKTGKEVHLVVLGEETEIDKTMVDVLADPLIHIIRNAIDHGLESDANGRTRAGKAVQGALTLRAFHKSGNIVISVSDDGRGINKERVRQKAIANGVLGVEENLSDSQIFALIMQPGFSTVEEVSDLSGRGVGLDVVKSSIEKLRGKIDIDSKEGEGTTFSLILPLTLAIIDGMLVRVANETYIIPTLSVIESLRPAKEIVHCLKDRGEFVSLRGKHIPILRLSDVFEFDSLRTEAWDAILVCVETQWGQMALLVDELLGRQQVVIKTLGKSLAKVKEISGGAILGDGNISLILNVDELRPISGVAHVGD